MGDWVCSLSWFFAHVDGEGVGNQGSLSMAYRVVITEHDFGWSALLAIEGKEMIFWLCLLCRTGRDWGLWNAE